MEVNLTDAEFIRFRRFIHDSAGISLSDAKKPLIHNRLAGRLRARALSSYGAYYDLITSGAEPVETQTAIDLLTTNETYFFREQKHFDFLREVLARHPHGSRPFRVWSAAASSGEEAYSLAMLMADVLGDRPWEILGTDLSSRVLAKARLGHYPIERAQHVPKDYLRRFCLKGNGPQAGTLLVSQALRSRVSFEQVNLVQPLPDLGLFDAILLRNVMIYFDKSTKTSVVGRLLSALRPGGHFIIGHTETLHEINETLQTVAISIYRKPESS